MVIINFILHIDRYIDSFITSYGALTYLILFVVIFGETGLVIAPFLPGDSLIFAAGTFAGLGSLSYFWLYVLFTIAAVLGDNANYLIGKTIGKRIVESKKIKYLNETNLDKAHAFINKYGAKAVVLARFMPIIRTLVPFILGIGEMNYKKFTIYNIIGGILWVSLFINLGYFFGNIDVVRNHFSLVIIGIVMISALPIIIEVIRNIIKKR